MSVQGKKYLVMRCHYCQDFKLCADFPFDGSKDHWLGTITARMKSLEMDCACFCTTDGRPGHIPQVDFTWHDTKPIECSPDWDGVRPEPPC